MFMRWCEVMNMQITSGKIGGRRADRISPHSAFDPATPNSANCCWETQLLTDLALITLQAISTFPIANLGGKSEMRMQKLDYSSFTEPLWHDSPKHLGCSFRCMPVHRTTFIYMHVSSSCAPSGIQEKKITRTEGSLLVNCGTKKYTSNYKTIGLQHHRHSKYQWLPTSTVVVEHTSTCFVI